jgi:hypothetical protein
MKMKRNHRNSNLDYSDESAIDEDFLSFFAMLFK